jgi:succinoglycan biosynthesis protein ExoA
MTTRMKVTVAVVTYNAEDTIQRCLDTLLAQDYPLNDYEILVIDGCSDDRTRELIRLTGQQSGRIRLVENPGRTIASNRNRALHEARYPFVAFTDADCEVPKNWLKVLTVAFRKSRYENLIAVGGSNVPPRQPDTPFLQALGIMLNTFLGSLGSVQGRIYPKPRLVDSLACLNILYDREKVLSVGVYDTDMKNIGEDAELHFRLRKAGFRILYVPESVVYHKMRPTPLKWARNMFNYGRGRMVMFRKHREMITFRYLLPLLFILTFILAPLGRLIPVFWFPLLYFPGLMLYSLALGIRYQFRVTGWIFIAFLITHWCYSVGMAWQGITGSRSM